MLVAAAALAAMLAPGIAMASGSGAFTPTGSMGTARGGAMAAALPDGRVLVAGGFNDFVFPGQYLSSAEVFNPSTNSFSSAGIGSMPAPRAFAGAAGLPGGQVLVAGGFDGTGPNVSYSSAEVFNSATNSFSSAGIGSMSTPRLEPAAATLPSGRVLVAGGVYGTSYLASAETFSERTGNFALVGSMGTARAGAAAAPLPDGRVLVAGGFDGSNTLKSAEIFDPATNTFSSAGIGSMSVPREGAAAAPLPDGRVLISGGGYRNAGINLLQTAEVFDPKTNQFSSIGIGAMGTPRWQGVAAPLPDGRVLVAGSRENDSSAEIFGAANGFGIRVSGTKLVVTIQASGKLSVVDASSPLSVSSAKKKRKRKPPTIGPSSASGDPPTISVPLVLGKAARSRLKRNGKVTVKARITFAPQGGLSSTQTAELKIKSGKRKKR
jgi:hypothetical protein